MEKLSRASKALHRTSKNLRDSTPPGSPHRSHFGSLREKNPPKVSRSDSMKFQISAPVELISSTSMISYTSKSLRSPSPTGRTASSIGYVPNSATSSPAVGASPMSPIQSPKPQTHIIINQKSYHHQPPSPASASGESIKGPFSPEVGLAISDVLTPPTTPPPDLFPTPRRSRSSSIGKNAAMNAIATRNSGSIHRIKSTSSLSSSISAGSSHESYKADNEDIAVPAIDPRRTTTAFGPASYKPAGASHTSNPSISSTVSQNAISSPIINANVPSMPPPPPRVSARRSASNPNFKVGPKRSASKSNPFAHELAQVSELAEDMGIDLVDNDFMVRKGLQKFSAKDYLNVIRDVMLYPLDFSDDESTLFQPLLAKKKQEEEKKKQEEQKEKEKQADSEWLSGTISEAVKVQRQESIKVQRQESVSRQRQEGVAAPAPTVAAPIVPARRKPTIRVSSENVRPKPVASKITSAPTPTAQQQPMAVGGWI
ncbi:hypothetical protein TWF694_005008 [Orbilia ellipsospora]|uniref:Uncharacterized protein n=1 Tax=Orbilia ellipsospora TaxID=2528407 RepID=A0AAV9WUF8_9PEZI